MSQKSDRNTTPPTTITVSAAGNGLLAPSREGDVASSTIVVGESIAGTLKDLAARKTAPEVAEFGVADPDSIPLGDDEDPGPQPGAYIPPASGTVILDPSSLQALGQAIGASVASGMAASAPRRKVSLGEYKHRTAFHPNGVTPTLRRPCFQNGVQMRPINMFDKEIELLNAITHSGRYMDRKVEVLLVENGADDELHLRYNNKTKDQVLDLRGYFRNLTEMLQIIVDEQAKERALDELHGTQREQRRAAAGGRR